MAESSLLSTLGAIGSAVNPIAGAVGAIASPIASLISGNKAAKTQKQINQANIEMQRETNAQQYKMFQEANEFSRQQAIEAFNREAEYNDPSAQVARSLAAGLNPFGTGSETSVAAGNVQSASPSSASPPALTAPQAQMIVPGSEKSISMFSSIAQALSSLAQARKAGADTKAIEAKLPAEIEALAAGARKDQAIAAWNELETGLNRIFGFFKHSADIQYLQQKIKESYAHEFAQYAAGGLSNSQIDVNETIKELNKATSKLTGKKAELAQKEIDTFMARFRAQLAVMNSQVTANRAAAAASQAMASLTSEQKTQLRMMRDDNVRNNKAIADRNRADADVVMRTVESQVNKIVNLGVLSDVDVKKANEELSIVKEKLKMAQRENDWAYWNEFWKRAEQINDGITNWIPLAPSKGTPTQPNTNPGFFFSEPTSTLSQ